LIFDARSKSLFLPGQGEGMHAHEIVDEATFYESHHFLAKHQEKNVDQSL